MRVVAPGGLLLVKWNDNQVSLKRFLACIPTEASSIASLPASRGIRRKGSSEPRSRTCYVIFVNGANAATEFRKAVPLLIV